MIHPLSLCNRSTTASRYISDQKNHGHKNQENDSQAGLPCLDKPVLVHGGGGGTVLSCRITISSSVSQHTAKESGMDGLYPRVLIDLMPSVNWD